MKNCNKGKKKKKKRPKLSRLLHSFKFLLARFSRVCSSKRGALFFSPFLRFFEGSLDRSIRGTIEEAQPWATESVN